MKTFEFYNRTRVVLGQNTISRIADLVPRGAKVLLTYGGGSIKANGVYAQVMDALKGFDVVEFGGIEPNPLYETLMKAVEVVQSEQIDFILAVGGGSVVDGSKFIAAAVKLPADVDPWAILADQVEVTDALPLACVLTLPATGTESNPNAVISRKETTEKLSFAADAVFPVFAILDPLTTYTLPEKQVRNGIVDAFTHVMEQYMTQPCAAPLQDRFAESILQTLVEIAPDAMKIETPDYDARANLMWCATMALNTLIGKGVVTDWATHGIGHELTAFYGVAHAESLAIVMPGLFRHEKELKRAKLLQYAERVWGITGDDEDAVIEAAIARQESFYHSIGMPTRLSDYGIDAEEAATRIEERFAERGTVLGEADNITPKVTGEILRMVA
ncbi:MAG: iron-containing alcohol dehydrogenase [Anaerolineaceae bacterium]|nr:iron-containing alcohol dehydrogenase [Anaerolineaceae bacterium]